MAKAKLEATNPVVANPVGTATHEDTIQTIGAVAQSETGEAAKPLVTDLRSEVTEGEAERQELIANNGTVSLADQPGMNNPDTLRVEELRPLSDFEVAPIAPDGEYPEVETRCSTGSCAWAMVNFASGYTVRRSSWTGMKALDPSHQEGRIILHSDDLLARDWVCA